MTRKPKVKTKCVANAYTGPTERIVEFSARVDGQYAGGLISLREVDGKLRVEVYRCSENVTVVVPYDLRAGGQR